MLDEVKYLGVTLDFKLRWNHHLQVIIRKTQTTFAVIRRTCVKQWGLRPNIVHWLYTRVIRPSIYYGALLWCPKAMQQTAKTQLGRIQRTACLAVTGAMRSTPTAAMEVLLDLTLLDLLIMAEARMALYRLHIPTQTAANEIAAGLLSIQKSVGDPTLEMRSDYTIPIYYHSRSFNVIIDLDYWKNKNPVFPEDALIWFTDGSRADSGIRAGIFGLTPNRRLCFPLVKYATVFQTEVYAILQCAYKNIRAYKGRRVLIFSDSQAALKALGGPRVASVLVTECLNEVTLVWVPGHCGIFVEMKRLTSMQGKHRPHH
jgi:hypothetical protein